MEDFEGTPLQVGDEVVFSYNRYKRTVLKRGVVYELNIPQANMMMVRVQHGNSNTINRVATWNIFKLGEKI